MQPGKRTKTACQKRHTRSTSSPWAVSAPKKAARSLQWRLSKFPIQYLLFEQFLKDHNLTYASLHALLAEHFDREVRSEAQEDKWSECEIASKHTEYEVIEVEELEFDANGRPFFPHRTPTSAASASREPIKAEPKAVDLSVGVLHTDGAPPTQHSAQPFTPSGERASNLNVPPWNEIQTIVIEGKAPRRPPRIRQLRPKKDPQARVLERDLDRLLQNAPIRRFSEWKAAIRDSKPKDIPFTLFGPGCDGGSESSQTHTVPVPHHNPIVPVSDVSEGSSTYRGVWGDHRVPVPEAETDLGAPAPDAQLPNDFFAFGPVLHPDDAASKIQSMRELAYYKPVQGAQGGYAWALGKKPGSAGYQVRERFRSDGHCRRQTFPSLAEISCFTEKRTLPSPIAVDESDCSFMNITRAFPYGSLFKIEMVPHPRHMERCWHGSNLYCAYSLFTKGPQNYTPANGPPGVYCFTDPRAHKVPHYCVYILSGSGCAWTVFAQFAVPPGKSKKFSADQRCAQAQDIIMTALWFHGIEQREFSAEYIWPTWVPALEINVAR